MAKILFVCHGNVARSQMAEAYYNHFTNLDEAVSGGVNPYTPHMYKKLPDAVIEVMAEENIDVSHKKVKYAERSLIWKVDKIFVLCKKELCPDYISNNDKSIFWDVADPDDLDINSVRKARDDVKRKVFSIV